MNSRQIKKMIVAIHLIFWPLAIISVYLHLWSDSYGGKYSNLENQRLIAKGEMLYTEKKCTECHGLKGAETAVKVYPLLVGQNAEYLEKQLQYFQSGQRLSPESPVMLPYLQGLSAEDLKAISAYLEAQ